MHHTDVELDVSTTVRFHPLESPIGLAIGLPIVVLFGLPKWLADLLALVKAPPGFRALFLQGGGSLQFSMIPMHLLRGTSRVAEYIVSGYWSEKAVAAARLEGQVEVLWSGKEEGYRRVPTPRELAPSESAAYLHYVSNETVEGLCFPVRSGPHERSAGV